MEDTKGLGEILVWNSRSIFQEREIVVFLMNKCSAIAERIQSIISSQMGTDDEDGNAEETNKGHIIAQPSTLSPE